jgi:hypothetical protein
VIGEAALPEEGDFGRLLLVIVPIGGDEGETAAEETGREADEEGVEPIGTLGTGVPGGEGEGGEEAEGHDGVVAVEEEGAKAAEDGVHRPNVNPGDIGGQTAYDIWQGDKRR